MVGASEVTSLHPCIAADRMISHNIARLMPDKRANGASRNVQET
jgi:hypothetical protein